MKTSLYTILCIAIRLGAVIWAAGSLINLPFTYVAASNAPNTPLTLAWLLGGVACQLILAFLFWLYPGALARVAAGRATHEFFESSLPAAKLQYVAFSVVGIWFVLQGLVYLAYEITHIIEFSFDPVPSDWSSLVASSTRVVFGIALVLGARGLTRILSAIRQVGNAAPSAAAGESAI